MFYFKMNGVDQLAKQLRTLGSAVSKQILEDALREAAKPMRAHAAELAPRRSGQLASHIAIGTVASGELKVLGDEAAVEVGPELTPDDVFYGIFSEYGTVHHPAQPFMRPAFDAETQQALDILGKRLWAALTTQIGEK